MSLVVRINAVTLKTRKIPSIPFQKCNVNIHPSYDDITMYYFAMGKLTRSVYVNRDLSGTNRLRTSKYGKLRTRRVR